MSYKIIFQQGLPNFHAVRFVLHVSGTADEAEKSEAWC